MQPNPPKILIATPTCYLYEYCLKEFAAAVKQLTYPRYDLMLADNSPDNSYMKKIKQLGLKVVKSPHHEGARDRIVASRNLLRQHALEHGYDYLLSLEQDVLPPKDVIERLLSHQQKIVSGLYCNLNNQYEFPQLQPGTLQLPLAYQLFSKAEQKKPAEKQQLRRLTLQELPSRKIMVRMSGLGCVLIHKSVLEKISFSYYPDSLASDDRNFSDLATSLNIPIILDPTIRCLHLTKNKPFDWATMKK